jgi:cyclophilin family peptidyl-prolyl cis-trans isomerase
MFFRPRPLFLIVALLFPLRLMGQNVAPVVTASIGDVTVFANANPEVVPLEEHFDDPDTSGVRLTTNLGKIDLALYDERTPITVANFKKYIDSGRYFLEDPTDGHLASLLFHRSVSDFVIQSGGWLSTVSPTEPDQVFLTAVEHFDSIENEPGISNTTGTIAMAKLPNAPDSATSEWFINLEDNLNLDTDNGGFTVFGRVIGDGMTVVDAIAAVPVYNFGSPFDTLPLQNFTPPGIPGLSNLITIPEITYVTPLTFTASSDKPAVATVSISDSNLLVTGKQIGTAKITVTATDADGAAVSTSFDVTVIANPVHLANISTRAVVGTGDGALIGGFIVRGDAPKKVIIRALGPSLGGAGITDFLADPTLEIHDSSGAQIAFNNNWQDDPNSQSVIDAGIAPTEPNEAAMVLTLPSDDVGIGYTAVVHGTNNGTGVGLVEVYDVDSGPGSSVLNISTRSDVGTGEDVLIGGFIVFGEGDQRVLVRAIGPSLTGLVPEPLADPTLTLVNAQGTQIDFNDNWQDNPDAAEIEATTIPPTNPDESAVIPTLSPGNYTAIVRGTGIDQTGTGLVEVYALPPLTGPK